MNMVVRIDMCRTEPMLQHTTVLGIEFTGDIMSSPFPVVPVKGTSSANKGGNKKRIRRGRSIC